MFEEKRKLEQEMEDILHKWIQGIHSTEIGTKEVEI
jgi:hypothetical protein